MGVVSTLNAGAEQIPTPPAAAVTDPAVADVADVAVEDFTPPARLPWGAKPKKLKIGKAGSSSKALAAAGAAAALPEPGDKLVPEPVFEPKGEGRGPRALAPKVVPPAPRGIGVTALAAEDKPNYFWATAYQKVANTGSYANLVISKPTLHREDYHSLGEIAVQTGNQQHTVEVGWTVNRAMHGDDEPHLFVYHWIDKTPTCYNACGFVPYSKTVVPGMTLPQGVSKRFGIQYFKDGDGNGAWWVAYDSEWVGFFPDKLWGGRFTQSGVVQWYGEVATDRATPCGTWMGTGDWSESGAAARIGTIALLPAAGAADPPATNIRIDEDGRNPYYSVFRASDATMRYGGGKPPPMVDPDGPDGPKPPEPMFPDPCAGQK